MFENPKLMLNKSIGNSNAGNAKLLSVAQSSRLPCLYFSLRYREVFYLTALSIIKIIQRRWHIKKYVRAELEEWFSQGKNGVTLIKSSLNVILSIMYWTDLIVTFYTPTATWSSVVTFIQGDSRGKANIFVGDIIGHC
jgi:hypothetical protein